ncbi:unnamed protein product [Boreogadus saida]
MLFSVLWRALAVDVCLLGHCAPPESQLASPWSWQTFDPASPPMPLVLLGCTLTTSYHQLHYRATRHALTGVCPAFLLLGREFLLPRGFALLWLKTQPSGSCRH